MECSFDFSLHLHNGDPLSAKTVHEPSNRPPGTPPFTWEASALDALKYDRATDIRVWDLPTIFWFFEQYNGWGYRTGAGQNTTPPQRSPYLYSGTMFYQKGKYTSDNHFDPDAVSEQVGCMAQLKELELRGLVSFAQQIEDDPNTIGSVAAWQNILNGCGYYPVLFITGGLDAATQAMTKRFQKDLGLSQTGTVDLKTWQAGLSHKKLSGWSAVTPQLSSRKNPLPGTTIDVPPSIPPSTGGGVTRRLFAFYNQAQNYDAVYNNVMSWYGTMSNACVAFASTALRLSGYNVPKTKNSEGDISLWTSAFAQYLIEQGWTKFTDASQLERGDVVFTDDGDFDDGIPMHTYVFAGWQDQRNGVAWVIDNQDFRHLRNIDAGGGGFNFTPFAYFLRA